VTQTIDLIHSSAIFGFQWEAMMDISMGGYDGYSYTSLQRVVDIFGLSY